MSTSAHDRTRLDGCEIELFQLVKKRATPEQWKEWLRAPLEHAAADGNTDLFTRLIHAGADGGAGWRGCHGRTLLGAAASSKNERIVAALLEAGAKDDINVLFGEEHQSALHVAADEGVESISEALMFAGADPNLRSGDSLSPLHLAADGRYHGLVGKLLHNGALPDFRTSNNNTPLHLVLARQCRRENDEDACTRCVSVLLSSGADKDVLNDRCETPLFLAVVHQHPQAVELLLAACANINIVPVGLDSLLVLAASRRSAAILKALLQHGCEVNGSVIAGYSALHSAAEKHDAAESVHALLEAGADVEATTDANSERYYFSSTDVLECAVTPLHVAAMYSKGSMTSTLRALVDGGANVHAQTAGGRTALHIACGHSDSVEAVEILLRAGASESPQDEDGYTPLDMVVLTASLHRLVYFDEKREAQDTEREDCICRMLACAPADRAWRRRSWLALCRFYPTRAQLAAGSNRSPRPASDSGAGGEASDEGARDGIDGGLVHLVGMLVTLEVEDIFRLVVSFL